MKPRTRGQLGATSAARAVESRPCVDCRGATDADGRCGPCGLVLPTAPWGPRGSGGCEPVRTCPTHGTKTLTADGWCNPRGDVWHIAGPRLERDGGVYREREVPVLVPRAQVQAMVRGLVRAFGQRALAPGDEEGA